MRRIWFLARFLEFIFESELINNGKRLERGWGVDRD